MHGAIVAQNTDKLESYIDADLACMWAQGLKMGDNEVFVRAMRAAGPDRQGLLQGSSAA